MIEQPASLRERLVRTWYAPRPPWSLRLMSWLFAIVAGLRRLWLQSGSEKNRLLLPVVVVGNITVGGSGKTPFVLWLAERLREWGWKPGIVSRGYGGIPQRTPRLVTRDADPAELGDEPVLMAQRLGCPVVVCPDRLAAARALQQLGGVNIVLSDDGLQHYALPRDLEIAVVDGTRGLGNGWRLPAGPLRESARRLRSVDLVAVNGVHWTAPRPLAIPPVQVQLRSERARSLARDESRALTDFAGETVHAVAGIGYPVRFFAMLSQLGIQLVVHPFPDHHAFCEADLDFGDSRAVLMTEKDAVKCRRFARPHWWCVPVHAELSGEDTARVKKMVSALRR